MIVIDSPTFLAALAARSTRTRRGVVHGTGLPLRHPTPDQVAKWLVTSSVPTARPRRGDQSR